MHFSMPAFVIKLYICSCDDFINRFLHEDKRSAYSNSVLYLLHLGRCLPCDNGIELMNCSMERINDGLGHIIVNVLLST